MIDTAARIDKWTDYYDRNRNDGGPIQALFDTNAKSLARKAEGNLNDVGRLTDFITGSSYGNMILVPGRGGTMRLVHHGFACNTKEGFTLAFAHGNLGDCTAFKTIQREELVAPVAGRDDNEEEGEGRTRSAPTLDSMLGAESADEFAGLEGEGNDILDRLPNHCFITPDTFIKSEGSKQISSKNLAFYLIEKFQSFGRRGRRDQRRERGGSRGFGGNPGHVMGIRERNAQGSPNGRRTRGPNHEPHHQGGQAQDRRPRSDDASGRTRDDRRGGRRGGQAWR